MAASFTEIRQMGEVQEGGRVGELVRSTILLTLEGGSDILPVCHILVVVVFPSFSHPNIHKPYWESEAKDKGSWLYYDHHGLCILILM